MQESGESVNLSVCCLSVAVLGLFGCSLIVTAEPGGDAESPDLEDAAGDDSPVAETVPDADVFEDPAVEPGCGNGILEEGEECDGPGSGFCDDACRLVLPSGWSECEDGAGRRVFYRVEDPLETMNWGEFREHCRSVIESQGVPAGFRTYGLAVLDNHLFNCMRLDTLDLARDADFWVGAAQRETTPECEPAGCWWWNAFSGAEWLDIEEITFLSAYDIGVVNLTVIFNGDDGEIVEPDIHCAKLHYIHPTGWIMADRSCTRSLDFRGICTIVFEGP
jgi:hypothetical protein